ncbi:hypothetical protein BGX26_003200 [Mortierella sp. AD094]|nr:hypothetical protein BGX26_003200 [Mortierella sp. AD094]
MSLSSFVSQLFANQSYGGAIASAKSVARTEFSWVAPWTWSCWTLASDSTIFAMVTTRPTIEFLPQHSEISDGQYLGLSYFCLVSLYVLLVMPFPRTTRTKQIVAFPLLFALLYQPLFVTCPTKIFHMVMAVTSIAVSTRMIDLYYVQPWTGIPSRYCVQSVDETARSKKDLDDGKQTSSSSTSADNFLMWDMERFKVEMWAPLRKFSGKKNTKSASQGLRWQDLILLNLAYDFVLDIDIFFMSRFTAEELEAMALPQYAFCMLAVGIFIMIHILWIYLTVAMIYSMSTGRRIDTSEWTMLKNKLPCFALTPADFWVNWQTLFRYLWVDLAFLPVQRLCKKYVGPERVGSRIANMVRLALPILAVFALSGILHAYIVYSVWREPIWSQLFYFMTQAVAVVVTKVVERSAFGAMIKDTYNKGGPMVRFCLQGLGFLIMVCHHVLTLPFFMEPYKRHEMWLDLRQRSILWWIYGK